MDQPMLSLVSKTDSPQKTTPHLLPCRVHHNGDIEPTQSYWAPTQEQDGKKVAYFRGRKLHGRAVKMPDGYRGVIAERSDPPKTEAPRPDQPDVIDVDAEDEPELGKLEAKAEFDELIVWGHETTADAAGDPYIRSVEEWLALSEQIHSYEVAEGKP
ncbi:hypothetical protein NKR23_g4605 [Pleurostoma richardsiae]|uniref:Uncharacterized protein n=1 Tax=Pleurostoma richardsiae TaxID=41990 RepID=A0AA38RV60_9PEZI|nr:hypothetical protein NKR23_g4605 [Pleurostoma richardsiae]